MTEQNDKYLNWTELQHALGDNNSTLFINQLKPYIFFDGMVEFLKFDSDAFSPNLAKKIRATYCEGFYNHFSTQAKPKFNLMYEPNLHGHERHTFNLKGFLTVEFIENLLVFKTKNQYFIGGEPHTKKIVLIPDSLSGFLEAVRPKITETKETAYNELVHTFDFSGKTDYNRLKTVNVLFSCTDILSNAKKHKLNVNLVAYQEYLHLQAQKAKTASIRTKSKGDYDPDNIDDGVDTAEIIAQPNTPSTSKNDFQNNTLNINKFLRFLIEKGDGKNIKILKEGLRLMIESNMTDLTNFEEFIQFIREQPHNEFIYEVDTHKILLTQENGKGDNQPISKVKRAFRDYKREFKASKQ